MNKKELIKELTAELEAMLTDDLANAKSIKVQNGKLKIKSSYSKKRTQKLLDEL